MIRAARAAARAALHAPVDRPRTVARCAWCGARLFNGTRARACRAHADVERIYQHKARVLS